MLDEKREYINYTTIWTGEIPWLRYGNLSNHLSGIEHAMTIVARGFLFADETIPPIVCAKAYLRAWCGLTRRSATYYRLVENQWERTDFETVEKKKFDMVCHKNCLSEDIYIEKLPDDADGSKSWEQIAKQFPEECFGCCDDCRIECDAIKAVHNWLPQYIWVLQHKKFDALEDEQRMAAEKLYQQLFPAPKQEEDNSAEPTETKEFALSEEAMKIFPLLYELYNKRAQFAQHIFHVSLKDTGKAKNKEITYERIIANALNAGSLQTYTLYTKKKISNVEDLFDGITKASAKKENKALGKTNKPLIMAITAVYLMKKKEDQNYVVFNTPACTNWLQGNLPDGGVSIFRYNDEPLFYKSIVTGNVTKLCVNSTWLKDMGLGVCLADQVPEDVTVISYKYKKNDNDTGNDWDLVFELSEGKND